MKERVLSSRRVFEGQILNLRVDEIEAADGHRGTREVVEHAGAAGAVVVHEGHLVLVRQYRHAPGEELLEVPAGKLSAGETPDECIVRELVEEIGLRPNTLSLMARFYTTPGFSNEIFHLYFTDDLEPESGKLEAGEVLEVERVPFEHVPTLLSQGRVKDAKTIIGLSLLLLGDEIQLGP